MNKKVVFGCLGAAALMITATLGAIYFVVIKPMIEAGKQVVESAAPLIEQGKKLTEPAAPSVLETAWASLPAFTPPGDGLIQQPQLDRLLQAITKMEAGQAKVAADLEQSSALNQPQDPNAEPSLADIAKAFDAVKELGKAYGASKDVHIQSLLDVQMSRSEFEWLSDSVGQVLAQQVRTAIEQTGDLSQVSDELKKIEQALPTEQVEQLKRLADQAGIPVQVQPQVGDKLAQLKEQLSTAQSALQPSNPEAIAANAKLIEPHRQQLEKLLGMRMVLGADSLLDGIKKAASEAAQAPAAAGGQQ
jgi:hypothetical protein